MEISCSVWINIFQEKKKPLKISGLI